MNYIKHTTTTTPRRPRFGLFEPHLPPQPAGVQWLINGFPARIMIWTQEQWAVLQDRPSDAQLHPTGVWCALRME
jgi:hypothetical protein